MFDKIPEVICGNQSVHFIPFGWTRSTLTPEGGTIRLIIQQAPVKNGHTMLIFIVKDTGIGMSEEFLKRPFLPFEQEDSSASRNYGGTKFTQDGNGFQLGIARQ